MKQYDAIVIGGGIAGFEAALVLRNFRRNFLWIGAEKFGEKLLKAQSVRNFPSFSGTGAELCALLERQSAAEELPFLKARVSGVYAADGGFFVSAGEDYFCRAAVLATGVEVAGRVPGEERFLGRGVSYCAVCDGALYRGKTIAAVLSGKEFSGEADYLAGFAKKVYAFCPDRSVLYRAENIEKAEGFPLSVEGGLRAERLVLKEGELRVDGVFFLRNSAPPAALAGGLALTEDGHVKVGRNMETNLAGLFAAGDVTGRPYQYAKAAGEGLVAANAIHEILCSLPPLPTP